MNTLSIARAKDAKEFWAKFTLSAHHFLDHFKELAYLFVNNQDDVIDSEADTFDNTYVPDNVVDELKGHAQAKIIKNR